MLRYFRYYSYSRNPTGREFFDRARTLIAVNLLSGKRQRPNEFGQIFLNKHDKSGKNAQDQQIILENSVVPPAHHAQQVFMIIVVKYV